MSLIDRVKECQRWERSRYRPFRVDGLSLGWVTHSFADRLKGFPAVFAVSSEAVDLAPGLQGFEARSRAVDEVLRRLQEEGLIKGWREEAYPVGSSLHSAPLLKMERAAVPLFGVRAYGVHLNGSWARARACASGSRGARPASRPRLESSTISWPEASPWASA